MAEQELVEFDCTLEKVQNLRSGGYRVTLDVPAVNASEAAVLLVYSDAPGVRVRATLKLSRVTRTAEEWEWGSDAESSL